MSTPALLVAAGVYALLFWSVAAWSSRWALLLIFAVTPFQNDVSGGGPLRFSLAEVNLLLCLPILFFKARRLQFGPTFLPACVYLAVCLFSALGQWRPSTAQSLVQAGIFTVALVTVFASLARETEDYRLAINGLIVVAIALAFAVFLSGSSYVFGLNKNGVGASLASTFVVALEMWLRARSGRARTFYLLACLIIGFGCLITVSRGAWLTAITGSIVVLLMHGRIGLILKSAAAMIPLLALGWWLLPENSREYALGFGHERTNIQLRYESIAYAQTLFAENPLQGAGMGLRKDYDATNVVLLCLAETGVPGLLTFLGLNAAACWMVWRPYRRTPPHTLAASLLVIAPALIVGKFMHGLVDHYWSRGSLTTAWAAVGMATFVISEQRRQRRRLARELAAPDPAVETLPWQPVREAALAGRSP
ncbi:MAG: hypothetical protein INR62_06645 [Rhodospirillales bacterium]|nr:hypothetical protein [Acetobacter sp.]